jgi:ABC-type branched-subunit amino acid transport system ATPase component
MLLTLIQPSAGEIVVLGKNLQLHRREIMRQIGSIIEKPDFHLYLSAFNNLKIQARLCGLHPSDKELHELIEMVGLKGRERDKVKTYSHGMKQRLGLAQALVHNPQIVILDEPTTGLDPQGIIDLRVLILRLKNEMKKTVLLSSHILSEIEIIADSMTIIAGGKAVVQGKVKELLSNEDLIIIVEPENKALCAQALQSSLWQNRISTVGETTIELKLSKDEIPELNAFLSEKDLKTYSVSYKRTLEDYFLKLTNHHV